MTGNVFIIPVDDAAIFAFGFVTALGFIYLVRGLVGTMVSVWPSLPSVATEPRTGGGCGLLVFLLLAVLIASGAAMLR